LFLFISSPTDLPAAPSSSSIDRVENQIDLFSACRLRRTGAAPTQHRARAPGVDERFGDWNLGQRGSGRRPQDWQGLPGCCRRRELGREEWTCVEAGRETQPSGVHPTVVGRLAGAEHGGALSHWLHVLVQWSKAANSPAPTAISPAASRAAATGSRQHCKVPIQ
jgi:hypothetical protein